MPNTAAEEAKRLQLAYRDGDPFAVAIHSMKMACVVTAAFIEDNPIVFANRGFTELTGYQRDEIIGMNCRFLQGAETDWSQVARLREATGLGAAIDLELINYRKDGTSFLNALHISPIRDDDGRAKHFLGSQLDVTGAQAELTRRAALDERRRQVELALEERWKAIRGLRSVTPNPSG